MCKRMKRKEIEKKLKEIITDDECNWHIRDTHWIPEIIELIEVLRKETAKAIFEDIEGYNEAERKDEFIIDISIESWKKLKEKWLK